jgi:putative addiction module antidote
MVQLTVRRVGNSLGVTLPAQAAQTLHVKAGDKLFLTEAPGGFRITPYDPRFAEAMEVAEDFMSRYKNALRDLAR